MPRLPFGIAESQLPSTGGIRGGTIGIPAAQEPGVDPGTATLADRAISEFGQQTEQAGQFLVQAETYRAQSARAQDVLDKTLAKQDALLRYQKAIAERNEGDYRTLPDDVVKMGKDLFEQVALERKLSPQAKALFREDFGTAIVQAQHQALTLQTGRRQQDSIFAVTTEVQNAQQAAANAKDEEELQQVMGRLGGTLQQGVSAGLWHGDVAAKMYRETELTVRKDRVLRHAWTDPVGTLAELRTITDGSAATTPALQNIPVHLLDGLLTETTKIVGQAASQQDHEDRRQRLARKERQDQNTIQLRNDVITLRPTAANIPALEAVVKRIEEAGTTGALDDPGHAQLLHLATGYLATARAPAAEVDDPTTERNLSIMMVMSTRPNEFARAREALATAAKVTNPPLLKAETIERIGKGLEAAEDRNNPLNRDIVKEARDMVKNSVVAGVTAPGMPTTMLTAEQANALRNAVNAFDNAILGLNDPREADRRAREIGNTIIDTYVKPEGQGIFTWSTLAEPLRKGGPNNQIVPNVWWAGKVLDEVPWMTDPEKGRQLREYIRLSTTQQGLQELNQLYVNPAYVPVQPPPKKTWMQSIFGGEATTPPPSTTPGMGGEKAFAPVRK